jgi:ubiquinone/menaquinone biosynthesis C-methylase UbiE
VTFAVAADAYDRFMGRYSAPLAPRFADFAGVTSGQHVLDVGCGPGALTGELVTRAGANHVSAADPSESFVQAARERNPGTDVRLAPAENLPFADRSFDVSLAQLVVHFMSDPVAGLREMARVTRSGGAVAACVWDFAGGRAPLSVFWAAARELDPEAMDESNLAGAREGHLGELLHQAGLRDVEAGSLSVEVEHQTFEEWWEPFTLGVGPAGAYANGLDPDRQAQLRERCREKIRSAAFVLPAYVWAARGRAA